VFDGDPHQGVGASVFGDRWLPGGRVLVAFGLVDVVGDGDQLWVGEVVGEFLPGGGGPEARAGAPGLGERDDVVDVHVGGRVPGRVVVGAVPAAGYRRAGAVDHDVGAVALQHGFAGVAGAGDGDPVREQGAGVAAHRPLVGHRQHVQLGLRVGLAGNVRRRRLGGRRRGHQYGGGNGQR